MVPETERRPAQPTDFLPNTNGRNSQESFEGLTLRATSAIRAGRSAAAIRAELLELGVEPLTADTAYRAARRRMFESHRLRGARLALYAILILCGSTLLFVPLRWTVVLSVTLAIGLILMVAATLVWLTGLGADEP